MWKTLLRLSLLLFILTTASCKDDPCPEQQQLPLVSAEEEYGCVDTRYGLKLALQEDFVVVRSQADFDRAVTSSTCDMEIDFSVYDLIIGNKTLPSGNHSVDYNLSRLCPGNSYLLQVVFNQDQSTVAPMITYHALVPKLKRWEGVEVAIVVR